MPKFRVKKYDTFIEFYPGSTMPKKSYQEGSIVEIDDISKCNQAHKLEEVSEKEAAASEENTAAQADDDLFVDPLEMNGGNQNQPKEESQLPTGGVQVSEADRRRAAEKLRRNQGQA